MQNKHTLALTVISALFLRLSLFAANPIETIDNVMWEYSVRNGAATITAVQAAGDITTITVPDTLGGYPVSTLGGRFNSYTNLVSVVIPSSVNTISANTFHSCKSLKSVTLSEGLTDINTYAFDACTSLEAINIPSTLKNIYSYAFSGCQSLVSLEFNEGLVQIDHDVFNYCSSLKSVKFPSTLTKLGQNCFSYTALEEVELPDSVTTLGNNVFSYCKDLKTAKIGSGLKVLPVNAFNSCKSLKSVTLSEGLQELGLNAFSGCSSLKYITLPSTLVSIGSNGFLASGLEKIEIPDSVTSIGSYCFNNCASLRGIVLGKGITSVPLYFCYNCPALHYIEFRGNYPSLSSYWYDNARDPAVMIFVPDGDETWKTALNASNVYLKSQMSETPDAPWDLAFYKYKEYPEKMFLTAETNSVAATTTFLAGDPIYFRCAMYDRWNDMDITTPITNTIQVVGRDIIDYPHTDNGHKKGTCTVADYLAPCLQGLEPGKYTVVSTINYLHFIPETTYSNNTLSLDFEVLPSTTITFISEGIELFKKRYLKSSEVSFSIADIPIRYGYDFDGWYTEEVGGELIDKEKFIAPEEDRSFYAHWVPHVPETINVKGTLNNGENVWLSGNVYVVDGSVVVPRYATLIIQPGAIIKLKNVGVLKVESGAKLIAKGMRTLPIVFTSINDDSNGGKTVGSNSFPMGGDWGSINIYGEAEVAYCTIMYGAPNNETGLVQVASGGSMTMNACTLAHAKYDGIWNWGGSIKVTNTIIFDVGNAIAPYRRGDVNEYNNCVFYGCNDLSMYWSHWTGKPVFNNCIFMNMVKGWVDTNGNGDFHDDMSFNNCCFWNEPGIGKQSCEKETCVYADPLLRDPEHGDFQLRPGSPCIDAANATAAPATDYYGHERLNEPDIGICEYLPNSLISDFDLVPISVGTDSQTVLAGQSISVSWSIRNAGSAVISGNWRDTISLISNTGKEVSLGEKTTIGTISLGETISCSEVFTVPAIDEGTWYLKVNVNSYHDIFEGSLSQNNVLLGKSGIEVGIETISDIGCNGNIDALSPKVLKLELDDNDDKRMVHIDVADGTKVYYGFGFVPSMSNYSGSVTASAGGVCFRVPDNEDEVYITLESEVIGQYEIVRDNTKIEIKSVSKSQLPSSGIVTIMVEGAGFDLVSSVELYNSNSVITQDYTRIEANSLLLTVDCTKLNVGIYSLRVFGDDSVAKLDGALSVIDIEGAGHIEASLIMPEHFRQRRETVAYVEYVNTGNADAPLPIFVISSDGEAEVDFRLPFELESSHNRIVVIGLGDYSGKEIAPGASYRIPFMIKTISAGSVGVKLSEFSSGKKELAEQARSFLRDVMPIKNRSERFRNVIVDSNEYLSGNINYVSGSISGRTDCIDSSAEALLYMKEDGWSLIGTGQIDAHGHFTISTTTNGTCRVVCPSYGCYSDDITLETNGTAKINLFCNNYRELSVRVEDPIDSDAQLVCVSDEYYVEKRVNISSDFINIESILPLRWNAWIEDANGVRISEQKEIDLTDESGSVSLSLLKKRNLRVRVFDATGSLLDGIFVSAMGNFGEIIEKTQKGIAEFCDLRDREIVITAFGDGYVNVTERVFIEDEEIDIVLENGYVISDVIAPEDAEDCFVLVYNDEYSTVAKLTEDGFFSCNVPSGTYSIMSKNNVILKDGIVVGEQKLLAKKAMKLSNNEPEQYVKASDVELYLIETLVTTRELFLLKLLYGARFLRSDDERSPAWLLEQYLGKFGHNEGHIVKTQRFDNDSYYAQLARENTSCANPYYKVRDAFTELIKKKMKDSPNPNQRYSGSSSRREHCVDFGSYTNVLSPLWGGFRGTYRTDYVAEPHLIDEENSVYRVDVELTIVDKYTFEKKNPKVTEARLMKLEQYGWATPFWTEITLKHSFVYKLPHKDEPDDDEGDDLDDGDGDQPESEDPNEMVGPKGFGDSETQRFVKPGEWMTYTVYFENKAQAAAAAQEVFVTNPLSEYLDWSTFEMGEVAYNNHIDLGLVGKQNGESEIALENTNYRTRTSVKIDKTTGQIDWYLRVVDPTTPTKWPDDPYAGFLPPNDETHRGEGHLTYRIKVREDAPGLAKIDNAATIVFDYNDPIPTDPAWWNTVAPETYEPQLVDSALSVYEGETAEITVFGGSTTEEMSVKLNLTHNTTTAADIQKGLKFPMTLTWAKGEVGNKTVNIAALVDKSIEADEFFTCQVGESLLTVTIKDAGYEALKERVENKTASAADLKTWASLEKAKKVYGRAIPLPYEGGKVSGSKAVAVGAKMSFKATANKGYVPIGWYDGETLLTKEAAYSFVMPQTNVTYFAKFMKAEDDANEITIDVGGTTGDVGNLMLAATNLYVGVKVDMPIESAAVSKTTVKVAKLPTGLKYDAKLAKITGVPTKAGVFNTTFTVTTAGKVSKVFTMPITTIALPSWAVGTFNGGYIGTNELPNGLTTLTITAAGKISGKIIVGENTWTVSAANFTSFEDEDETYYATYRATLKAKCGKSIDYIDILVDCVRVYGSGIDAYQNLWKTRWKDRGAKIAANSDIKKNGLPLPSDFTLPWAGAGMTSLQLKFAASGKVSATANFELKDSKGKPITYKSTCSTVLIPIELDSGEIVYALYLHFTPNWKKGFYGSSLRFIYRSLYNQ